MTVSRRRRALRPLWGITLFTVSMLVVNVTAYVLTRHLTSLLFAAMGLLGVLLCCGAIWDRWRMSDYALAILIYNDNVARNRRRARLNRITGR